VSPYRFAICTSVRLFHFIKCGKARFYSNQHHSIAQPIAIFCQALIQLLDKCCIASWLRKAHPQLRCCTANQSKHGAVSVRFHTQCQMSGTKRDGVEAPSGLVTAPRVPQPAVLSPPASRPDIHKSATDLALSSNLDRRVGAGQKLPSL
jgi:hypothetical protein